MAQKKSNIRNRTPLKKKKKVPDLESNSIGTGKARHVSTSTSAAQEHSFFTKISPSRYEVHKYNQQQECNFCDLAVERKHTFYPLHSDLLSNPLTRSQWELLAHSGELQHEPAALSPRVGPIGMRFSRLLGIPQSKSLKSYFCGWQRACHLARAKLQLTPLVFIWTPHNEIHGVLCWYSFKSSAPNSASGEKCGTRSTAGFRQDATWHRHIP